MRGVDTDTLPKPDTSSIYEPKHSQGKNLDTYAHLSNKSFDVLKDFTTGTPSSVLLNSISWFPGDHFAQNGVMFFEPLFLFGFEVFAKVRKESTKAVLKSVLL